MTYQQLDDVLDIFLMLFDQPLEEITHETVNNMTLQRLAMQKTVPNEIGTSWGMGLFWRS